MNTQATRIIGALGAGAWMLLCAAPTDAAAAGSVTLLSQERVVEATAIAGPPDSKTRTSVDVGPFSESVSAFSTFTGCLSSPFGETTPQSLTPGGGNIPNPCITVTASAQASQDSMIATRSGALEVRAREAMSKSIGANSTAGSTLTITFVVEGTVPFALQGDSNFGHVSLTGPGGAIVDLDGIQGTFSREGFLPEGTYTFAADMISLFGYLNVRFTAGAMPLEAPRCTVRVTRPAYGVGDVVTASTIRIENPFASPIFTEVKMWLRLPDGALVPVRNEGADGSVVLAAMTTQNFGPVDVMGVSADLPQGLWEFGCRLLDPVTGHRLYENSDLFEIR